MRTKELFEICDELIVTEGEFVSALFRSDSEGGLDALHFLDLYALAEQLLGVFLATPTFVTQPSP